MPVPALPMAHFVLIQADLLLGQFNGFFHPALGFLPPARSGPRSPTPAQDEVIGDPGGIGEAAPGQQPLLPARLGPAEGKLLPGPVVEARPLTAFSCRETLPGASLPTGHDFISPVGEPDTLVLRYGQHVGLQALFQPAA